MKAMSVWRPRQWSIALQLALVATLPALLMFFVIALSLYVAGRDEARQALDERGRLIAAALAETGEYGVVSGNTSYLERSVRQFIATDASVSAVEIQDAAGLPIVSIHERDLVDALAFKHDIGAETPDVNLFDSGGGPHVSAPGGGPRASRERRIVGTVQVWMSPGPIQAEKRRQLYVSTLLVLLTTTLSGLAGLYLAQRLCKPLRSVMGAIRQIRKGDYAVSWKLHRSGGELGELQEAIKEMAEGLDVNRQALEDKVAARTRDLQQAIVSVAAADAEKRQLIVRTHTMLEEERQRIAIEIHDDLNAALIVVNMKAQHIGFLATPLAGDIPAEIGKTAADISATTDRLYGAARKIVKRLRPEVIDTLGLVGAIEEMVRGYDQLHPNCRFTLSVADDFTALRGQLAITCYRVVQEALSNVVKHADASHAAVTLDRSGLPETLLIVVSDDGKGFDPEQRSNDSIGLIGMRERVVAAGGLVEIKSDVGRGTRILICLPEPRSDRRLASR